MLDFLLSPMTELFIEKGELVRQGGQMMRGRMIGFTLRLGGILLLTATWGQLASLPAAEPAAANNGRLVFAAGNFDHAEISTDAGLTWTNVPLPAGPSDAPILCCDQDVVIDDARRVVFHSYLYINSNVTNGVVRIDVLR